MFRNKKTILLALALALGLATEVANADFTFGTPTNLGPVVNSSNSEADLSISPNRLSLFFGSDRPGGYGSYDIWVSTRATAEDDWGAPVNLGPTVNSSVDESVTSISADGLLLFFHALDRPGGYGGWDIWVTTRATTSDTWGTPVNLGPTVNSSYRDSRASISGDGLSLYFDSDRPGGNGGGDIWVTTRATTEDDWGIPVNFGPPVNSSSSDSYPNISVDGLAFFFVSGRPGGFDDRDIWVTTRATTQDDWADPVNLGLSVNSSSYDGGPEISGDGSTLFFFSERSGGVGSGDIWQTPIKPVVDLNGDETVDSADMCTIVDHWGENYSLCDIGPMPWGDGVVDVEDLKILAEHLFEEFLPPDLTAYWKLDETEADIAYDSAAINDAVVFGGALWQPTGGAVEGALKFDGIDDYVNTPFILDPAETGFSIFVWAKGAAPGQVIVSQQSGANWLILDAEGKLMTELAGSGRDSSPLLSQAVITDGQWHRIGLVWDGSNRTLCVDGVVAAEDTQSSLEGSSGGLYIGAGKDFAPGTFFSGLIDDVRIYNRAVRP